MSNQPEKDAFRLNDQVDEKLQEQAEETSRAFLQEVQSGSDKVKPTADAQDNSEAAIIKAFAQSLNRIGELASRLPPEMLAEVIDNNKGVVERTLLAGIDPRNQEQRNAIMSALSKAVTDRA